MSDGKMRQEYVNTAHGVYLQYLKANGEPKPRIRVKAWNEEHALYAGMWRPMTYVKFFFGNTI